jgi:LmbE family N-acetylglucosaminyl deacetylase
MKLHQKNATFFIPDQKQLEKAITRTTYMSIAAHQDDIEIMAYDGILKCFIKKDEWFFGVVVTDGSGSSRSGVYEKYSDLEMIEIRREEQRKAAVIGKYGALAMLEYPSAETKDPENQILVDELTELIKIAQPKILYTHNLADKHDTHIGVTIKVIQAIRQLKLSQRPQKLYGCEVWRNLDWMIDEEKVSFDVSQRPKLAVDLIKVFDSQIAGGKRYDLATIGRRNANATYAVAHATDGANQIIYAMDLTPLVIDDTLDVEQYVLKYIEQLKSDVSKRIRKMSK